ncbi:hypothetical protein NDU88_003644 [Pleurodeles waltl]|uniref:Uncharacterized protein n=1 Tax=Pleurodeles waltl TaxID=8319 RepID=A0AAV7MS82_PLEWA|nr:hypothetical protein NDU88_003644 [Pleurodeles waltl]
MKLLLRGSFIARAARLNRDGRDKRARLETEGYGLAMEADGCLISELRLPAGPGRRRGCLADSEGCYIRSKGLRWWHAPVGWLEEGLHATVPILPCDRGA